MSYKNKEEIIYGQINNRDGSAVYGSNTSQASHVRTFKDGKLKIAEDGLLQHDNDGLAIAGDVRNSWIGVSTLQALFIREHNAICDALLVCIYILTHQYICLKK